MSAAGVQSDPYGGLSNPYKFDFSNPMAVPNTKSSRPGVAAFPEKRTVDPPQIKTSSTTDRKKTNAQIVYTRVTKKHHQLRSGAPEGVVFVSRSFSEYDGTGINRRSIVFGLEAVNKELEESAKLRGNNPLDVWRIVEVLREWTVDGVLLGLHEEVVKEDALNVCIAGHCLVRNMFDTENVFPMDMCYVCLVAELRDAGKASEHFGFSYIPCTSRVFADHNIAGTVLSLGKTKMNSDAISRVVGAWKIGRVVDSAAVKERDQHSLTVNVCIEWVDWRVLLEEFPDAGVASKWLKIPGAPRPNPCEVFHWPTRLYQEDGTLEPPSIPERSLYEIKMDKHIDEENKKRCAFIGPSMLIGPMLPPALEAPSGSEAPSGPAAPPKPEPAPEEPATPEEPSAPAAPPEPLAPPKPTPASTVKKPSSPGKKPTDSGQPASKKRRAESQGSPPGPLNPATVADAKDRARKILDETYQSIDKIIDYLKNTTVSDQSELPDWFKKLKSDIVSFRIRFSKIVYRHEKGQLKDDSGFLDTLMEVASALQEFQRKNPVQDSGASRVVYF